MVLPSPLGRRPSHRGVARVSVALCVLLTGCYSYQVAPPASLIEGAELRLRITPDGAVALTDAAGLRLQTVDGRLQQRTADGALVVVPSDVTTINGDAVTWRRGALTIPASALESTQHRALNRRRTTTFAGVIAGVFTGAVYFTMRSIWGGGGNTVGSGPGTPE
ncbi:MAG: hypothetical protein V4813_11975 [Gemmatimonadota bacterium]